LTHINELWRFWVNHAPAKRRSTDMYRFVLSVSAVLVLAIFGTATATERTTFRDLVPVASSSVEADRLAMHEEMHKHMDKMMGNMQQPAPAHPSGNPQPADPHANQPKPADPATPGAAHAPPANPANPPAHSAQPPANQGMKHM
jgi:hypothetical protein